MIEPRPYQKEAIDTVLQKWKEGITKQLICLPTGAGKTIVFGLLIQKLKKKTLVVAHRDELLTQAVEKIRLINPDADIGIFKGQERDGLNREICVASIQTASRHMNLLKDENYRLIICDEAHHASAGSYTKLFKALDFHTNDPDKLLFGCTATAYRSDENSLNHVFQDITYEKNILQMIREGYLCDVQGISIGTDTDIRGVHTQNGDFAVGELETAVDIPGRNTLIAEAHLKHAGGKKGVVFGVSVEHAQNIAHAFLENGVTCEAVWGSMNHDAGKDVLRRFHSGEIQVISNCLILTEGFDSPEIEVVMMARPTKIQGLYIQCVGRGLRTAPMKEKCLLLDFVDIARKHSLCNINTLVNDNFPIDPDDTLLEAFTKSEADKTRDAVLKSTSKEVDLFGHSRFLWANGVNDSYCLKLGDGAVYCVPARDGGDKYQVIYIDGNGAIKTMTESPLTLDYAQGIAEDIARKTIPLTFINKRAAWRKNPATSKQIDYMTKLGIQYSSRITKGEAQELIDSTVNPPLTLKQLSFIRRNNLHNLPEFLTKRQAMIIIGKYMGTN